MAKPFLILSLCLISYFSFSQKKHYRLISKNTNADIDYKKLQNLSKYGSGYFLLNRIFKPSTGHYTVYRFIATYRELSHRTDKKEDFHDLIILKCNENGIIIDAFQYTLEWGEIPFTIDLYRSTRQNIKLIDLLTTSTLKFVGVEEPKVTLQDVGYLQL